MGLRHEEEMYLAGKVDRADWMRNKDPRNNAQANMNSESFNMVDGQYMEGVDILDGNAVEDMTQPWATADQNIGV